GRVLAADVISPADVPAHDNSAMDGYAFASSDLTTQTDLTLNVVGTAFAGRRYDGKVGSGECVRIMTGAVMPQGCDTVVPQEFTQMAGDDAVIVVAGTVRAGDNRRLAGEDLALGKPVLAKGKVLRPADLGLLASLGIGQAPVQRRLRVAFFSSGDELRSIGEPLEAGCVYDSNRYTIQAMLARLGCDMLDLGVVKDDPAALDAAFRRGCAEADAIITSGGVSVGAADYTRQIMGLLGDVLFWKIGMRPGRPMAFGQITSNGKQAYVFGLPGNPVAVMVTFYFFVREALLHMMNARQDRLPLMSVRSQSAIRKKPGRTEYQRGILSADHEGRQQVRVTGSQGSGILRSMSEANCMIVLHHEQGNVNAGDMVEVVLFDGLI
ncbi:MAG: molybdopterin molybdotransferase MoeA, partial [Herminiimonas sp.]|nr:molybdopterin molybdotransferase MoeA [Herminiimonas sp.]